MTNLPQNLALRLREGLLRPRRRREPDQGVAGRSADRPHELLPVPGEPVARVADGCRAYVLMQELRLRAARTGCARTQVTWLRNRLLKLGVHVVGSVRRIVLHLPRATPHLHAWRRIALALGARAD